MDTYTVIGIMSGTSLDGVDIAACTFKYNAGWTFTIDHAETIDYSITWKDKLSSAFHHTGIELTRLNSEYGKYLGTLAAQFISRHKQKPDFIASHGHTIFHQPQEGFTLQVGDGNQIAAITGLPVIYDFRSLDVALGGQGAPLVPIGDRLLFGQYHYCLNLGGFANISFEEAGKRIAFDICPVNIVMNELASRSGHVYDKGGQIGASGRLNQPLLEKLNNLSFYQEAYPRSLGREWVDSVMMPLLNNARLSIPDMLNTYCHHIAIQISAVLEQHNKRELLITGGGTNNQYLLRLIGEYSGQKIIIPDSQIINFKEALIFAFLGVLRFRNEVNCFASVTGACRDSSCGVLVNP